MQMELLTGFDNDVEVPASPVPPILSYPQLRSVKVPAGSRAVRAYEGFIRPFYSDENARHVLRAIHANSPLTVAAGRLSANTEDLPHHQCEPYLTDMAEPCSVMVLEYMGNEHPRAYLIEPVMKPKSTLNPHVRVDLTIRIRGSLLPALCVYSGNAFSYHTDAERIVQFLDQLSTYLAKHLIWTKTLMLYRRRPGRLPALVRLRKPGDGVSSVMLAGSQKHFWYGCWPGQWAPTGPAEHLRTVDPEGECWCCSGILYKHCHRLRELTFMQSLNARGVLTGSLRPLR